LAIGKTLEEALKLTDNDVIHAAGGIPARKAHCSLLAIRGLHEAILNYRSR
jgi:nitrogen fixation NifU-like protein